VKGAEFVRRVAKLARARGVVCRFDPVRGKGSHGTLYFGGRRAVVPNLSEELKTGTLHGMLKQLGLRLDELR
jgi:mRNA interferase HicA